MLKFYRKSPVKWSIVAIVIFLVVGFIGMTNYYNGSSSFADSSPYTISKEIKPTVKNEATKYQNVEFTDLNKYNFKIISELYFLDSDSIIFSADNGKNKPNIEDLYKYNLKTKTLSLLCPEYTLYGDEYINVKDAGNFSIIKDGFYIRIENNKVKVKRNLLVEAIKKNSYASSVFYNENNDKMLLLQTKMVSKTIAPVTDGFLTTAYVTKSDFSSPQSLPFKYVSRVQWANDKNVLVCYKDSNNKSYLAKYNLSDKSIVTTALPDKTYFIDPVISDNQIIRFLYLETQGLTFRPWGFLDF
jgi:hypothetical protein